VEVVGSGRNEGSARGFGTGLKAARELSDAEFIWILDDDNCPEVGALDELKACYLELGRDRDPQQFALMALRTDRQYLMRIAGGADPKKVFARENSFLDFHILDAPKRVLWKLLGRRNHPTRSSVKYARIPFGIYGGLLFHKRLLDRVGYPDEDFYLYGDDTDFTARITEDGGELFLVPGSRITDIERSWHVSEDGRKITVFRNLAEAPAYRAYYGVRNSIHFALRHRVDDSFAWNFNRLMYTTILATYMRLTGRFSRARLIREAIRDGLESRMGRKEFRAL
jgi:GT2 family glycosyltransferase